MTIIIIIVIIIIIMMYKRSALIRYEASMQSASRWMDASPHLHGIPRDISVPQDAQQLLQSIAGR